MNDKTLKLAWPWYRHPWPWLLMLGPFVVVVAGLLTAYIAFKCNDGLVDDDYYRKGLAVNQVTEREQTALRLGLQGEVMISERGDQVRIVLRAPAGVALPEGLRLQLSHPTRAGVDRFHTLSASGGGVYAGKFSGGLGGRWLATLEDDAQTWRLTGIWTPEQHPVLQLPRTSP